MKKIICFTLFLLLSPQLFSQYIYSDTTWERWYGKQNYNESSSVTKNDLEHYDKAYIFHGRSEYPISPQKPLLKKTDINGYFLWERKLDSILDKHINRVKNYPDGGIVICGGSYDSGIGNPWVAKLNACMEVEWCKIFRWSEYSYAKDIAVDMEGNIIVLTDYYGYSPGERINLIKLSPEGHVLWKNNYATMQDYPHIWNAFGRKLLISEDNNYYIAGEAEWPTNNDPQQGKGNRAFFIKVNPDGEEEWILPFGIYDGLFGTSLDLFQISDHKFLSVGRNAVNKNPILHYFNSNGEELNWHTTEFMPEIYYSNALFSSKKISDTSFFALWSYFYAPEELYGHSGYMVFDTALNILNYKEDDRWQGPADLILTHNNKLVTVATMKEAEKTTYYDIYLSKRNTDFTYDTVYTNWSGNYDTLCTDGIVSGYLPYDCGVVVGINEIPTPEQYKESQEKIGVIPQPNPAKTQAILALQNTAKFKNIELSVYNSTGIEIYKQKIRTGSLEEIIDISNWHTAMYFIVMRSEGRFVGSAKLVVE